LCPFFDPRLPPGLFTFATVNNATRSSQPTCRLHVTAWYSRVSTGGPSFCQSSKPSLRTIRLATPGVVFQVGEGRFSLWCDSSRHRKSFRYSPCPIVQQARARSAARGSTGVIRIVAREVKFLDRCRTPRSEGILPDGVCQSRTRVWGSNMIRYRRSPCTVNCTGSESGDRSVSPPPKTNPSAPSSP